MFVKKQLFCVAAELIGNLQPDLRIKRFSAFKKKI